MDISRFFFLAKYNWLKLLLSLILPDLTKVTQQTDSDSISCNVRILFFEKRNRERGFFVDTNFFNKKKLKWSFPLVKNWAVMTFAINKIFQNFLILQLCKDDACAN